MIVDECRARLGDDLFVCGDIFDSLSIPVPQTVEQFGRKLLGGLLGGVAGGLGRGVGSVATGAAFSFATTYALGQLARRYYAGGRQMNTALLQSTYQSLLGDARELQQQNLTQIREKARTLDVGQVMSMVRN